MSDSNIEITSDLITKFVLPIITIIIGTLVSYISNERKSRSHQLKWAFRCLSNNKVVNDYLTEYREMTSPPYKIKQTIIFLLSWTFFYPFLVYFLLVLLLEFGNYILGSYTNISTFLATLQTELLYAPSSYTVITFVLCYGLAKNLKDIQEEINNLDKGGRFLCNEEIKASLCKYQKQAIKMRDLLSLYTSFVFLVIGLLYVYWTNAGFSVSKVYILILCIMVVILFGLKYTDLKGHFKLIISKILSAKYQNQFPIVHIKSKNFEYSGKVYNLCDDKLIFLSNQSNIISYEWENIVLVECEV